jgi:hypothetical protein
LQQAYSPMVKRIRFLAEKGLTPMMVLHDFLLKRIAPLKDRTRLAWLYTGENDTTWLERSCGMDHDPGMLEKMLSKLSTVRLPMTSPTIRNSVCQFAWTRP